MRTYCTLSSIYGFIVLKQVLTCGSRRTPLPHRGPRSPSFNQLRPSLSKLCRWSSRRWGQSASGKPSSMSISPMASARISMSARSARVEITTTRTNYPTAPLAKSYTLIYSCSHDVPLLILDRLLARLQILRLLFLLSEIITSQPMSFEGLVVSIYPHPARRISNF